MINGKFTVHDIARELGVTPETIRRWIRWYEEQEDKPEPGIPEYEIEKGFIKVWEETDKVIADFRVFRACLGKTPFAEYNARNVWGKKGIEIIKRKHESQE